MRSRRICIAMLTGLLVGGGWCLCQTASAQHKAAAKADQEPEAAVKEKSRNVWLRKIDWRTTASKLKSPEYTYRNVLQSAPKAIPEWHVVTATYDTAMEWADRVVVSYHVLLLNEKKGTGGEAARAAPKAEGAEDKSAPYTLLEGTVSYVDVKKGPGHSSAMFIRPNTIERHGAPVAVGIEITVGDETVVKNEYSPASKISQEAKQTGRWWTIISKSQAVSVRNDCLFNRSQTPFILVNYMDEESIQ